VYLVLYQMAFVTGSAPLTCQYSGHRASIVRRSRMNDDRLCEALTNAEVEGEATLLGLFRVVITLRVYWKKGQSSSTCECLLTSYSGHRLGIRWFLCRAACAVAFTNEVMEENHRNLAADTTMRRTAR
jgi:hypothetical protein